MSSQSLVDKVSFRLAFIRQEGTSIGGTSPHFNPQIVPSWFDPNAYKHAQAVYRTFSPVIGISHLYGLLLGISLYPALAPLIATGQSGSVSSLFTRYLSTNVHIRAWFTGGSPFDPASLSNKSLKAVRSLHLRVSSQLNSLTSGMSSVGNLGGIGHFGPADRWLSQWSMSQAQFAFMGLSVVYPEVLGFRMLSTYDRHCLLHFWRTIGHCLGIEDRFNLCNGNSDAEIVELCRLIWIQDWKPAIEHFAEPAGLAMAQDIATAVFRIVPFFNYRALMHYVAPAFGLAPIEAYQLKSLADYFYYGLFSAILAVCDSCTVCMRGASWGFALLESLALWGKDFHRWSLEKVYPGARWYQVKADPRCPVSVAGLVSYKAAWELVKS